MYYGGFISGRRLDVYIGYLIMLRLCNIYIVLSRSSTMLLI